MEPDPNKQRVIESAALAQGGERKVLGQRNRFIRIFLKPETRSDSIRPEPERTVAGIKPFPQFWSKYGRQ